MKVLMFGWEFPPYISGGLGTACFGLTKALAEKGTHITFILPKIQQDAAESHVRLLGANRISVTNLKKHIREFRKNIQLLEIDSPLRPYLSPEVYTKMFSRIDRDVKTTARDIEITGDFSGAYGPDLLSEIFRYSIIAGVFAAHQDFDVIHAHDWMTFPAGIRAKAVTGKPLVIHVHALEFDRSGDNIDTHVYEIEKAGMEAADRVIAVSFYTRDRIIEKYGIPEEKIQVVHNAVSKEKHIERLKIRRALNEKIVLFLGRVTFQKGPEYFIEAAHKVLCRLQDVRFVMAGTGDMFNRMVEMVAGNRIGRCFHFTGFLKGTVVERMYAMSDLYVMPSVSEPFGIAPLEAMLYDVPIIVSKQSGVAEILDHAIKVDFWDTDKLADSIVSVLTQPARTEEMVKNNTQQLSQIKWEIAADKTLDVYRSLTGGM
ncbi:MAG: glycosyltransferase family 4 protein [Acidobacteria bacterium]|nr:glycosyltransferase family 4 protein [Acidobacteriota bacterium]